MSIAAGKQVPLLTEAAAGFAARLLQQYDRLVAARRIHYFVQRCHLRGKQSGTIRLENTAMLLSQKRPRKQTRRGLYTCQSQCILLFQQQFESDWSVISTRRVKDGHLQLSHQKGAWTTAGVRHALDGLSHRPDILGLSPVCLPLHIYFSVVKRFAASKIAAERVQGHSRSSSSSSGVTLGDPLSLVPDTSILDSAHFSEFVSTEELQFVAETIDGGRVSGKQVRSSLQENKPTPRTDEPRAVHVTFPSGTKSHVCVEQWRTLCGQRIMEGRKLTAVVGAALPTCERCLTSGAPWFLSQSQALDLAKAIQALTSATRRTEQSMPTQ